MRVVATAGHVDHGKSSLVLALTGTDPDRFAEEKARGLTIDLGFAFTTLPSGETLGFVDVPGHVRFIKNMLAGVGGVDAAVFVVAANEGWMPQSEEHLRILDLLGIAHAIVVVSKSDLVDADTRELTMLDIADRLEGSALAGSPLVAFDAKTGHGLDDVRSSLDELIRRAPAAADRGRPRLWIDRVFAAKGAGTVVTGTLAGGSFSVDDEVVVLPGGHRARIRGLESHHERLAVATPGSRVAVNLAGIDHRTLARGHAVVRDDQWLDSRRVDVALTALTSDGIDRRGAYKAYVGSGEHDLRLRMLGDGFARVHLATPLPLAPGDRLVLRESGRQTTVGGAEVLDAAPVGAARLAPSRLRLPLGERLLAGRPWLRVSDLPRLAGAGEPEARDLAGELVASGAAVAVGEWLVAAATLATFRTETTALVAAHHRDAPLEAGLPLTAIPGIDAARARAALAGGDDLVIEHGRVRLTSHQPTLADDAEAHALVDALSVPAFAPPTPTEIGARPELVRALVKAGRLVDLDGVVLTAAALAEARTQVVTHLRAHGTVTVAETRDLLKSSRRFVLAILGRFDADGTTRRRGDDRILGPRADAADG